MKGVKEVFNLIFAITEIGDNGKKLCTKIPTLFLLSSLHSGSWVQILICVRSTAQYPSVKIRESICIFNDDVLVIYYAPTYWKYAPPSYCNIGL